MMQKSGQMPKTNDGHGHGDRRQLIENQDEYIFVDIVSKCKWLTDWNVEMCMNYHVGDMSMSLDIGTVDTKGFEMSHDDKYFRQFQFDFHQHSLDRNDSKECSAYIDDLSLRMCVKTSDDGMDTLL